MSKFTRRHIGLAAGMAVAAGLTAGALIAMTAHAADTPLVVGETPPDFTWTDINGEEITLSDFADQTVVLEWNNPECPYVMRHYQGSGAMPALQEAATAEGVVWITINSSGEGKQGYRDTEGMLEHVETVGMASTHVLLDHDGTLGHMYAATNTPHMYIVDHGTLAYQGAIDDNPFATGEDKANAHNYVRAALDSIAAGEPIETPQTLAYGCSMKYAS
ncbi:MAG: redoxin domain-containing protein [Maricaulaceae bacterium]|jgi:hypothetical protein